MNNNVSKTKGQKFQGNQKKYKNKHIVVQGETEQQQKEPIQHKKFLNNQ